MNEDDAPDSQDRFALAVLREQSTNEIADPAAFWASLTPEQQLALVKAAPPIAQQVGNEAWDLFDLSQSRTTLYGAPSSRWRRVYAKVQG